MRPACASFRDLAPELALGIAVGDERAAALDHLDGCDDCRQAMADLTDTVDALVQAAPAIEPPTGFEVRALARFAAADVGEPGELENQGPVIPPARRSRRLRPAVLAAAAAVVALIALAAAIRPWDGTGSPTSRVAAGSVLRTADGTAVGSVQVEERPGAADRLLLDLGAGAPTGTYRVECHDGSGDRYDAGTVAVGPDGVEWSTTVHVSTYDLERVRLISTDGNQDLEAEVS